jgi:hypothetical protein
VAGKEVTGKERLMKKGPDIFGQWKEQRKKEILRASIVHRAV